MPARLMPPMMAMNPKGWPVSKSPEVMPMAAKGMAITMMMGGRKALNSMTTMSAMITTAGMIPGIRPPTARSELSFSPPHSRV